MESARLARAHYESAVRYLHRNDEQKAGAHVQRALHYAQSFGARSPTRGDRRPSSDRRREVPPRVDARAADDKPIFFTDKFYKITRLKSEDRKDLPFDEPHVNAWFDTGDRTVSMLRNIEPERVDDLVAEDTETELILDVKEALSTRKVYTIELYTGKKNRCLLFERAFMYGYFCALLEGEERVVVAAHHDKSGNLIELRGNDLSMLIENEDARRRMWIDYPLYKLDLEKAARSGIIVQPMLNVWLRKYERPTSRMTFKNIYTVDERHGDQELEDPSLFTKIDTRQKPVHINNRQVMDKQGSDRVYYVLYDHELIKQGWRLVTIRNIDMVGQELNFLYMGWMLGGNVDCIRDEVRRKVVADEFKYQSDKRILLFKQNEMRKQRANA
jgi:hypothetical protein